MFNIIQISVFLKHHNTKYRTSKIKKKLIKTAGQNTCMENELYSKRDHLTASCPFPQILHSHECTGRDCIIAERWLINASYCEGNISHSHYL